MELIVLAVLGAAPAPEIAERATVRRVLDVWAARRARAGVVRWRVAGQSMQFVEGHQGKLVEIRGKSEASLLLDFAGLRHRIERKEDHPGLERLGIQGCDGNEAWGVRWPVPKSRLPERLEGSIITGNLRAGGTSLEELPYFLAEGFVATHRLVPGVKPAVPDPADYAFLRIDRHEGRECVVLREAGRDRRFPKETWTDLRRGVIVRHLQLADGVPRWSFDLAWRDGPGLAGWEFHSFGRAGIDRAWKVQVERHEAGVQARDNEFRMPLLPGMKVKRTRLGEVDERGVPETRGEEEFVVAADGTLKPVAPPAPSGRPGWLLAGLAAALGFVFWRWLGRPRGLPVTRWRRVLP